LNLAEALGENGLTICVTVHPSLELRSRGIVRRLRCLPGHPCPFAGIVGFVIGRLSRIRKQIDLNANAIPNRDLVFFRQTSAECRLAFRRASVNFTALTEPPSALISLATFFRSASAFFLTSSALAYDGTC
jgi:hypothetical protein